MTTETLHVTGMTCGGCENAVKRAIGQMDGVATVEASHAASQVTVTFDPTKTPLDTIKGKIQRLGYQVA
jgi:copper chaperone CopZ